MTPQENEVPVSVVAMAATAGPEGFDMKDLDVCQITMIHPERVAAARSRLTGDGLLALTGEFFRILGDATRLGILDALSGGELCVCDICAVLGMGQSAISHQLRLLRQARLVRARKEGKVVYYRLDDDHVQAILGAGLAHVREFGVAK